MRMRCSPFVLALVGVTPACSFLLDFDELTDGDATPQGNAGESTGGVAGDAGDSGGAGENAIAGGEGGGDGSLSGAGGETGGQPGEAGAGGEGGAACATDCDDENPCTRDGCSAGECVNTLVPGLALDGVDESILADQHVRATIAAASDGFFISDFFIDGGTNELSFHRLGASSEGTLEQVFTLAELELVAGAVPVSAAGLAMDNDLGRLHAFVGLRDRQAAGARVFHAEVDLGYTVRSRTQAGSSYWADSVYNYPVAAALGGNVYSAWINEDRTVSLYGGAALANSTLAAATPVSALALLGSAGNLPVVLYGSEGNGVFLERPNLLPVTVPECQTEPGVYLSAAATYAGVAGFWLTNWTKFGGDDSAGTGFLTSDTRGVGCTVAGCIVDDNTADCPSGSDNNLTRNAATVSAIRPGDRTGIVYYAAAVPALVAGDDGALAARLSLAFYRVDFGVVPFESAPTTDALGDPSIVSTLPTTEESGFAGPDWPILAYVPPHHLALGFIQPAAGNQSELRIQRYRMCMP
jgi:hypothetical protein